MGDAVENWQYKYSRRLAALDAIVIFWAVSGALFLRFGGMDREYLYAAYERPYLALTLVLALLWWLCLGLNGSRDTTVLGYGTEEYKRVLSASFWVFGLLAVASYALQLEIARGYVIIALPAGLMSLILARTFLRSFLRNQRRSGRSRSSVLLIGGVEGVNHLARALATEPMAGYRPIAAYLPNASDYALEKVAPGLLNLGTDPSFSSIEKAIKRCRPDAVAFSTGVPLPPQTIRELGWTLAELNIKMIMAPALTDIAGPRIHTQPVAGLPLIHVSTPNLGTGQRLVKRSFDVCGAAILILALSPVFLAVAAVIKIDSTGPALFRQIRIGAFGKPFEMYKFRSMVINAEEQLTSLQQRNEGNTVLFKLKSDPRITRVGHVLRRYSIDELPQLFNVLKGTMSLVGPRPPLPAEVEKYQRHVHRRLMVRPGLTGLWQVSGRSLLSWDDSVRLDLYYVENWSLFGDIAILLRTVRAVLGRHGAF